MKYSFWTIQSEKTELVNQFLTLMGFKINSKEKINFDQINLSKLWHRKYFFSGTTQSVLFRKNKNLFLLEETPSSLFYADIPNTKFSLSHQLKTILFFHYPEAKSAGLKIFENGILIRHLQSEIDYEICQNSGSLLSFESEIEKEMNVFNEDSLIQYLKWLSIPIPLITAESPVESLTMAKTKIKK